MLPRLEKPKRWRSPRSSRRRMQPSPLTPRRCAGMVDYDLFESIYNPGKMLLLTSWKTAEDSSRWTPKMFADVAKLRHRRARNVRDYGMFERREAAQYFPDAKCPMGSASGIVR